MIRLKPAPLLTARGYKWIQIPSKITLFQKSSSLDTTMVDSTVGLEFVRPNVETIYGILERLRSRNTPEALGNAETQDAFLTIKDTFYHMSKS